MKFGILIFFTLIIGSFLLISFGLWQINPSKWDIELRLFYSIFMIPIFAGLSISIIESKKN
jgi:hypothetical protein